MSHNFAHACLDVANVPEAGAMRSNVLEINFACRNLG